jgi:DNA gyrase inhibitor GyrI
MRLLRVQIAGRIPTGRGADARPKMPPYDTGQGIKKTRHGYRIFQETVIKGMRSWIVAALLVFVAVIFNGAAFADDKGAFDASVGVTAMTPEIKKIPKMTVAFIKGVHPTEGCGPDWARLMDWAGRNALVSKDTVYVGVSYYDPSNTQPEKARYDACITVPKGTNGEGDIIIGEIAGGDYAVFLHGGPYENLKETFAHIRQTWTPKTERRVVAGPYGDIQDPCKGYSA